MPELLGVAGCAALVGALLAIALVVGLGRRRRQGTVVVKKWREDGSTRVRFRGERWVAEPVPGTPRSPGRYRGLAFTAKRLVLEKV